MAGRIPCYHHILQREHDCVLQQELSIRVSKGKPVTPGAITKIATEALHELRLVHIDHERPRCGGNQLLARESSAPPFDQVQVGSPAFSY